jgi:hypothetical protein
VASHIVGKSGRAILQRIAEGPAPAEQLAKLALGSLKGKTPDLILALDGRPDAHFRWLFSRLLKKPDWLGGEPAGIDARLREQITPHADLLRRLCTIPGVEMTTARVLIAELGTDMTQFPGAAHAASWAGLCPANAESAGKRFSSRTRKGDRHLRRILVQSAWSAARSRDCFLAALFKTDRASPRFEEGRSTAHSCGYGDLPASAVSVQSSVKPPLPMATSMIAAAAHPKLSPRHRTTTRYEDDAHTTAARGLVQQRYR